MISQAVFKMVLPMACAWAEEQEAVILRDGVALTASQIADARHIGIAHPERVRLRVVEEIPFPLHPLLREAAEITGLISPRTAGLTLHYGIFIRSESWGERRLLVHELAHTAQYERLSVVSNRFLNNTYMSASYRRATRLARWNKKPSESSVRRVPNHALQRTAASHIAIDTPGGICARSSAG
jgi:hypothetical protein